MIKLAIAAESAVVRAGLESLVASHPGIDLAGAYRDAGVQLLISSAVKNDRETIELLASDVIPHFG